MRALPIMGVVQHCEASDILEVHVFDFSGDLYGSRLLVEFAEYKKREGLFKFRGPLRSDYARHTVCTPYWPPVVWGVPSDRVRDQDR